MENPLGEYRSLGRHFCGLCKVPVTLVDSSDRAILFTENRGASFFCDSCPNRCRLLSTMLYGCSEARRWQGRYIFYCPIGLVFSAVHLPETEQALVAGPMVMGDLQDTLLDLPDYIDKAHLQSLRVCSAEELRHMEALLQIAVWGLPYRPHGPIDRNVVSGTEQTAVEHNSFPYMRSLSDALKQAVRDQEKSRARETLNKLLRYVYSPHPDQFPLIRSRAIQLADLLCGVGSQQEARMLRSETIPALKNAASLEEMDSVLARSLHQFVDYAFDFAEIKHSDTIYRVMEYIKSNHSRKITLEEIAAYVHLSGSHVSSLFRRETGQTLSAYLSHVRIEKSKQLLQTTDVPISEIGALCGFEDQSYFSRVFKQQTGQSPKKYREESQ